ncbi:element excision factor XisH family protein [Aliterella atlantica]|uniref:Fatty-acid synthase n=1 Tax=Aliterella atlantica CENA595 TaxID=1618023 RepID=A0A0D8ZSP6_9CYAN|nr:element excision factor XisH family protein [Aliterella atlantica]KJH71529.1 fatty-acid synthase [Aliterella atlantica CENA595]
MPARDIYHDTVKFSLQKDGWTVTHDPFPLQIGKKRLSVDLGAERLISAEKGIQKIVVEVKSFVGQSDVKDLEQALGQYILYRQILNEMGIERSLYLAVSRPTFISVFTIELGQVLLKNQIIKLIVFDDEREEIVQWIPN